MQPIGQFAHEVCRTLRRTYYHQRRMQALDASLMVIGSPKSPTHFMGKLTYWLHLVIPVALVVHFLRPGAHTLIFVLSAVSMIPLAHLLSESTENLSHHTGPNIGALLNVTFGNAGELLIGFFALREGLQDVVKA